MVLAGEIPTFHLKLSRRIRGQQSNILDNFLRTQPFEDRRVNPNSGRLYHLIDTGSLWPGTNAQAPRGRCSKVVDTIGGAGCGELLASSRVIQPENGTDKA